MDKFTRTCFSILIATYMIVGGHPALVQAAVENKAENAATHQHDDNHVHPNSTTPLLVLLLDGFRWDYGKDSPGLKAFRQNATQADYLVPVFPSTTYPSLYSILTGLYPESNGIVSDVMYDPDTRQFFYKDSLEMLKESWWNASEPIWVAAKKSGRKVSIYSLPLCGVRLRNILPDVCEIHSGPVRSESLDNDLNDALQNLASGTTDFALVHFDHLAELGRSNGPDSNDVKMGIEEVDVQVANLMEMIKSRGLAEKLNVIITSTHGMANVDDPEKHRIQLDKVSPNSTEPGVSLDDLNFFLSYGAFVGIYPQMDKINKVFEDLKKIKHLDVYKRKDIPEDLHIKWNNRTAPIVVMAQKGYYIDRALFTDKQIPPESDSTATGIKGVSGYNPKEVHEMRGIFIAKGPGFEVKSVKSVNAVDIYDMMTCLLNVTDGGHPSNGTATTVCGLLKAGCPRVCGGGTAGENARRNGAKIMLADFWWVILGSIFVHGASN